MLIVPAPVLLKLRNRRARQAFRQTPGECSGAARRVIDRLVSSGVAWSHYAGLVTPESRTRLEEEVAAWLDSPKHWEAIEAATGQRKESKAKKLNVVNGYLGLFSRLRDPEDTRMVKVFACLSDVDVETGAIEYVAHSRPGEKYGRVFPPTKAQGRLAHLLLSPGHTAVCGYRGTPSRRIHHYERHFQLVNSPQPESVSAEERFALLTQ